MDKNILITMEYDGTRYDGWQKQGNTADTIQGKLEAALERKAGTRIEVIGSGRTDSGVHAKGQAANFHVPEGVFYSTQEVVTYLNRALPEDIRVTSAREVTPRFHSRIHAKTKTYAYYVETAAKKSVFGRRYTYGLGEPLDIERMREAASFLIGEHDFKSFCGDRRARKSTVRRVDSIDIEKDGSLVVFTYSGNGFLYRMARIMTGTLVEVGLGKREPDEMAAILDALDRDAAGPSLPAEGLFLMEVGYGGKN